MNKGNKIMADNTFKNTYGTKNDLTVF